MADDPRQAPLPSEFRGNFGGFIAAVQKTIEKAYEGEDERPDPEALEADARFMAAQAWLVERWGMHYACPVCKNVEWTVSDVGPAIRPAGYLSFFVTCGWCGNTMQIVPGNAVQDAPHLTGCSHRH